jgi:hypothetical protein
MKDFYTALRYYTMSAWMRGYASGLTEEYDEPLRRELLAASDMLEVVWEEYEKVRDAA